MGEFEHDESFRGAAEISGHLQLDRYETYYQELFSEALEDGVITEEERVKLESAAEQLGLDKGRLSALESALRASYEAHHGFSVLDTTRMFVPRDSLNVPAPPSVSMSGPLVSPPSRPDVASTAQVQQLQSRIAWLEERVRELESQLEEARAQVSYEVDFSDLDAPVPSAALDEPASLHRRLRHDPRDVATMHAMFLAYQNDVDRQFCVAQALCYLDAANDMEREVFARYRSDDLIQPQAAVDSNAWRRLLFHPDDETLTSDILSVIVSAVLLAHSAALKQSGQLITLDPAKILDPATTTATAGRCFTWAAQTLGMSPPALYADPSAEEVAAQMVPTVPPTCLLGRKALSGRSATELAFLAGHQLAYYRPRAFHSLACAVDRRSARSVFGGAGDRQPKAAAQRRRAHARRAHRQGGRAAVGGAGGRCLACGVQAFRRAWRHGELAALGHRRGFNGEPNRLCDVWRFEDGRERARPASRRGDARGDG